MERRIAEIPASEWDDLTIDLTPRDGILSFLMHAFPVHLQEPFTDDGGNLMSRPVVDADGNPVICREAEARRDALIEKLAALPPVPAALDRIVQHFGHEAVAEVTGRSRRVLRIADAQGERLALRARPASANLAEIAANIEQAVEVGSYEAGVETVTADSLAVAGRETLYAHPGTGAKTELVEIIRRDKLEPLSAEAALEIAGGTPLLMVNARSKRAAVVLPAPSRTLDAGKVRDVRAAFGLAGGPAMTGAEAFEAVMDRGAALALANGWRLARRRIMGAARVEIEGPADTDVPALKRLGCTVEIVSWRARVFAPDAGVLERILERRPLAA